MAITAGTGARLPAGAWGSDGAGERLPTAGSHQPEAAPARGAPAEAQRRESACAELLAVGGHLAEARLSGGAMSVLLELLSNATSDGQATLPDHDVRLRVTASRESMQVTSDLGDLVVEGRALVIGPASATSAADPDADEGEDDGARQGVV